MAVTAWRYVEMTFNLPGEQDEKWRAVLTEADSPNEAAVNARNNVLTAYPQATNVQEFVQRGPLTEEKATEVAYKMRDGRWEGWPLGRGAAA